MKARQKPPKKCNYAGEECSVTSPIPWNESVQKCSGIHGDAIFCTLSSAYLNGWYGTYFTWLDFPCLNVSAISSSGRSPSCPFFSPRAFSHRERSIIRHYLKELPQGGSLSPTNKGENIALIHPPVATLFRISRVHPPILRCVGLWHSGEKDAVNVSPPIVASVAGKGLRGGVSMMST